MSGAATTAPGFAVAAGELGHRLDGTGPAGAEVRFVGGGFPPLRLPLGSRLEQHLTVENSPVLFGCRTGICGTCLIRASSLGDRPLEPPGPDEAELLDIVAPATPDARLACQLVLGGDVLIAAPEASIR